MAFDDEMRRQNVHDSTTLVETKPSAPAQRLASLADSAYQRDTVIQCKSNRSSAHDRGAADLDNARKRSASNTGKHNCVSKSKTKTKNSFQQFFANNRTLLLLILP